MKIPTKPKRIPNWVRIEGCASGMVGWLLDILYDVFLGPLVGGGVEEGKED